MIRFIPIIFAFLSFVGVFADEPIDQPLPPEEAAATMQVPEGFSVTLFAGEPDVVQPIDFCIDDRGRLWICEARSYPRHQKDPAGDRIVILEDSDNDGKHDKRIVFYDRLNYVTGIEVGFGGAWVMSPPHFFFIPDRNGDDVPDGKPEVILDGFGNHANSHNLANGFEWGPDGWLYGTHGRTNWSMIGALGTPEEKRVRFDGGVWRIDPVTHKWEAFCDGTTNPWGIDWDENGEAFMTNCVNPHLFHVIQGAHYEPWRGRESSQHAYQRIATIADHLHYAGNDIRGALGKEATLALGGGHAHCGVLVYPRGGSWPVRFHGAIFLNNIHGDRINVDLPKRLGSGFTASHAPDLMIARDPWFMGVALQLAPDGSVYVSDWSDTGECHSTRNTRKDTGRIFKITYRETSIPKLDLLSRSSAELAELSLSDNRFLERHARRILGERSDKSTHQWLKEAVRNASSDPEKLKALWTLHCTGGLDDDYLATLTGGEAVHAWLIRLACEDGAVSGAMWEKMLSLAGSRYSALVQLHICSAAMRLPDEQRWGIVEALTARNDFPDDQNLPLMIWYLSEPLMGNDFQRFVELARSPIPLIREHVARRVASEPDKERVLSGLIDLLSGQPVQQKEILKGILAGLEGVRQMKMPPGWEVAFMRAMENDDPEIGEMAIRLALIFNDPAAITRLRNWVENRNSGTELRIRSLQSLVAKRVPDLEPVLFSLLDDTKIRAVAIRGLADFGHPDTPHRILAIYDQLGKSERQDALQTLASRPEWAEALLDDVEAKLISSKDVTAFTARQIVNLKSEKLSSRVRELWGELRSTSAEKEKKITALRKKLKPELIVKSEPKAGRIHFQTLCASCHKLFGEGGMVGPELTGSQRNNIDYLLENLVDPSASVSKDFQMQIIETTDHRVISGFAESENETALVIRSINEKVVIPQNEIKTRTVSTVSMMPEGLLNALSTTQLRELVAYLSSPHQVPLPRK